MRTERDVCWRVPCPTRKAVIALCGLLVGLGGTKKRPRPREQPGLEVRRKKITRPSGSHILMDTDNKKSPAAEDGASFEEIMCSRDGIIASQPLTAQAAGVNSHYI